MWSNKKTASFLWAKIWWVLTFCALSRLSFGAQPSVKINLAPPLMPHHAADATAAATRLCYTEPKLSSFTQRFLNQLQSPTAQPGFFFARHTSAVQCKCTTTSGSFFSYFFSTLGSLAFFSRGTSIYDAHCSNYVQKHQVHSLYVNHKW